MSINIDWLIETMGFWYYIMVYGIGIVAMFFSVIAVQFKRRVTIILSTCFGQISWILYFALQGDLTSAIACALSAIMLAVFAKKEEWKWAVSKTTVTLFIVLISGFAVWTFRVWSDIFPIIAGVFAVIANSCSSEKRLRQYTLIWCVAWLLNSTFKLYPVAFANDFLCTASTVIALVRYRNK